LLVVAVHTQPLLFLVAQVAQPMVVQYKLELQTIMEFLAVLQVLQPQKAVQVLVAVVVAVLLQMEQQQVQVEVESQVAVGEFGLLLEASTELRAQVVQV
jgi:hypothetical protein